MNTNLSRTNTTGDQADRESFMSRMRKLRTVHSSSIADNTRSERPKAFESLPLFGSLSAYDVDKVTEARLWELEANRLIEALGGPRLFPEAATTPAERGKSNTDAFDQVELLANPVLSALAIYALDDRSILNNRQSYGDLGTDSISEKAMKRLKSRFGHVVEGKNAVPAKPTPQQAVDIIPATDAQRYYALIDYLTATVAYYISSGLESDKKHKPKSHWQAITLTVIAKMAVKMKILMRCLPIFAQKSMLSWQTSGHSSSGSIPTATDQPPPLPASQTNTPSEAQDSRVKDYLFEMAEVSSTLFWVMWGVLSDLRTRASQRLPKDDFDISAIIYSMETRHGSAISAMFYQDRLAQVAGSHTGVALGMARRALEILVKSAEQIHNQQKHQAGDLNLRSHFQNPHPRLSIKLNAAPIRKISIKSVAELISVMVPLSCMDPIKSSGIQRTCNLVSSNTLPKIHDLAKNYTATVNFRHTAKVHHEPFGIGSQSQGQALSTLFSAPRHRDAASTHQGTIEGSRTLPSTPRDPPWARETSPARSGRRRAQLSISDASESWEIAETAITVACLDYTVPVIVGCAILVIGGLSAGFLVGEHIPGVDPFNLTMFSWIIAGFIVLIAKSIRVAEWPWHDFLLGRVSTRSVRELVSVTGLEEQDVLLHLLSMDAKTPLVTRGPFNIVFASKGDGGFSIDVQPTLETLLKCGIIVLEVLSPSGPVLMCLDVRMGVNKLWHPYYSKVRHNQSRAVNVLACLDNEESKDLVFTVCLLRWHKVIGIYYNKDRRIK